jgi:hypothetical protein
MLLTSPAIALAQFLYERRLRTRNEPLNETLRSIRSVERAKNISWKCAISTSKTPIIASGGEA